MLNTVSRSALATAALVFVSQGAFALEADAFADRFVAASKVMGISLAYGSANLEGDTVTLSDFTIGIPGEDDVEIPGDLVFEGVVETPDGGYTAQRATVADFQYTDEEEGLVLSFVNIAIEGIVLPAEVDTDSLIETSFGLYDRISAGPLTVSTLDGDEMFAIEAIETWIEEPDAQGGYGSGYSISGIRGNLSAIEEPEARDFIAAFGVEQISGSMSGYGIWWPDTGRAEIEDVSFVLDDLASFRIALAVEGYTRELYQELIKTNLKMAELAETGTEITEEQMIEIEQAVLESFSDLALESASIRYEDASLFMKVLDFIGAEQGVDGATFAAGLQFLVPMVLSEVEDPAFRSMVTDAVNTFINDPQSFEISVQPDAPLAFTAFENIDFEGDPFALVDLLNVEVTANQ